jgi:hypothetical protein
MFSSAPSGVVPSSLHVLLRADEVVAKSSHSTLYRAGLSAGEAVALLRFVRPACAAGADEARATARALVLRRRLAAPVAARSVVSPFTSSSVLDPN